MIYEVINTPRFEKDIKFYLKKKNYRNIINDVDGIVKELSAGNLLGDEIPDLHLPDDESTYKVRITNTSANVGKSNGFRLIYYVVKNDHEIYLLTIYSKKDRENISNAEIVDLIKTYCT